MKYTNDSDLPELTDEKFMATRTTRFGLYGLQANT